MVCEVIARYVAMEECPKSGWQYLDPKGNIQGPFTLVEMLLWYSMGYFPPDLLMRCGPNDKFLEFKTLFPPPAAPFTRAPVYPLPGPPSYVYIDVVSRRPVYPGNGAQTRGRLACVSTRLAEPPTTQEKIIQLARLSVA
jgi:hypothetical protein